MKPRLEIPARKIRLAGQSSGILKPRLVAIEYIPDKPRQTEESIVIENSSVDQTRKTTVVKGGKNGCPLNDGPFQEIS